MYSMLLDLIIPGQRNHRNNSWQRLGDPIGNSNHSETVDSLSSGGDTVVDTLQQGSSQVADTLSQTDSLFWDGSLGGSAPSLWLMAIAVVALLACISLAVAYRRRVVSQA